MSALLPEFFKAQGESDSAWGWMAGRELCVKKFQKRELWEGEEYSRKSRVAEGDKKKPPKNKRRGIKETFV